MSEKLEQVARRLCDLEYGHGTFDGPDEPLRVRFRASARAAIEAMRYPSQGMRIVGHSALCNSEACAPDLGHQIGFGALGDAWQAMIDEALK